MRECVDCLVPLVDAPPLRPEDVGDEDGDQLAYELDDIEAGERLAIDRELAEHGIVHAWDGTTLVVAPWDEAEVDRLLDEGDDDVDDGRPPTPPSTTRTPSRSSTTSPTGTPSGGPSSTRSSRRSGIAHAFDEERRPRRARRPTRSGSTRSSTRIENPDQLDPVADAAPAGSTPSRRSAACSSPPTG